MSYQIKVDDILGFASTVNTETKQKGKEIFFKYCPYCGGGLSHDKETFSINTESGAFKCFRASCDKSGHFVQLARDFNYPIEFEDNRAKKVYKALPQIKPPVREPALKFLMRREISADVGRRYGVTTANCNDNVLMFLFRDENDTLKFIKYRNLLYNKDAERKQIKEWCEEDTQPILFGIPQCKDFKRLIVTEGQLDSLAVATAGIDNAVSVPTGANGFTWVAPCFDWVSKFDEIIIFGDCEKGRVTLVDGFKSHFAHKRLKVVRVEDYLGEKDANDILQKYGAAAVRECVENAVEIMDSHVKRLANVKSINIEAQEHIKTGLNGIDKQIGGLYMGTVTLLTGRRGEGKSTLASQFIANALNQVDASGQPYSVFIYSGELPDFHFKRWLDLQIAGSKVVKYKNEYSEDAYTLDDSTVDAINAWYYDRAYIYDNTVMPDAESEQNELLEVIENVIKRYNTKLILIDNLMTAIDFCENDDYYRAQSLFVGKVKQLATKYQVAVLLIAHPRKEGANSKGLTNDSVSGSADITNRVDVVMTYEKTTDAEREKAQQKPVSGFVNITKNRLTGRLTNEQTKIPTYYSESNRRMSCNDVEAAMVYGCFSDGQKEENDMAFEFGDGGEIF